MGDLLFVLVYWSRSNQIVSAKAAHSNHSVHRIQAIRAEHYEVCYTVEGGGQRKKRLSAEQRTIQINFHRLLYVARSREQASKQSEAHKKRIKNNTSSCNFRLQDINNSGELKGKVQKRVAVLKRKDLDFYLHKRGHANPRDSLETLFCFASQHNKSISLQLAGAALKERLRI